MAREVRASAASTATGATGAIVAGGGGNPEDALSLFVDVSTSAGTSPTLDLEVQWSADGTNWASTDGTADTFAQITGSTTKTKRFDVKSQMYRVSYTIGGTAPSFTFSVHEVVHGR